MVRDIYPITCTYDADHDKSAINTQYIDLDPVFDHPSFLLHPPIHSGSHFYFLIPSLSLQRAFKRQQPAGTGIDFSPSRKCVGMTMKIVRVDGVGRRS